MVHSNDNADKKPFIEECEPSLAYQKLIQDDFCYLIDVRSKAEWNFVGYPNSKNMKNDIIFCEWAFYPLMQENPYFNDEILSKLNLKSCKKLFFICRSGSRSLHAAYSVQATLTQQQNIKNTIKCINVKFGFEGDLSRDKRRGFSNGWKFSGLPWKQS